MFTKEAWKVPEESKRTVFIRPEKHGSEPWGMLVETNCQLSLYCLWPSGWDGVLHVHLIVFPGVFCGTGPARTLQAESTACCSVGMLGAPGLVALWPCIRGEQTRPSTPPTGHTLVLWSLTSGLSLRAREVEMYTWGPSSVVTSHTAHFSYCMDFQGGYYISCFHASPLVY